MKNNNLGHFSLQNFQGEKRLFQNDVFKSDVYIFLTFTKYTKKVPTCISFPIQESFRIPTLILFETSNKYLAGSKYFIY